MPGCGSKPGAIFDPANAAYRWPAPPDPVRIRYLGPIASDRDLKPGRSGLRALGDTVFGKQPAREMVSPLGLCTDGGDRLFVADSNAQAVHVFDLAKRRYDLWRPPEKATRFAQPVAVAWDASAEGRLLVSDSVAGVVFVFGPAGEYAGTLGAHALKRPCGLVVDASRARILVADPGVHQVVILSMAGEEIGRIGERGVGPGQFNFPTCVALDSIGRVYVSDSLNFRVQVFGPDLTPLTQIGSKGDLPGYFSQPKGIALDAEDHLYIVDANFEAVQIFDTQGSLLLTFGHEGRGPGEFWLPVGVHIDAAGRVWVADSYNRRVQAFQYMPEGGRR